MLPIFNSPRLVALALSLSCSLPSVACGQLDAATKKRLQDAPTWDVQARELAIYIEQVAKSEVVFHGQFSDLKTLDWDVTKPLQSWFYLLPNGVVDEDKFLYTCVRALRETVETPEGGVLKKLREIYLGEEASTLLNVQARCALADYGDRGPVETFLTAARAQANPSRRLSSAPAPKVGGQTGSGSQLDAQQTSLDDRIDAFVMITNVHYQLREFAEGASVFRSALELIRIVQPKSLRRFEIAYNSACCHTRAGECAVAVVHLGEAIGSARFHEFDLAEAQIRGDADLAGLQSRQDFRRLMKRLFEPEPEPESRPTSAPSKR